MQFQTVFNAISKQAFNPIDNPEANKVKNYPLFDWLRFILASIVVLGHADFQFASFLTGQLAVAVFFALSGWLIGGILLRTEISELPRFFFNRSTRIWIPYMAAIIILYGIAALREGVDFFWIKYLVMDLTFTHQLFTFFPTASYEMPLNGSGNQFWSISVEEQFYLLAPLVMLFFRQGKTLGVWLTISAIAIATGSYFGAISLGVCAAVLQRDYNIAERNGIRFLAFLLAFASGLALSMDIGSWIWYTGPIFSISIVVILAVPGKRSRLALFLGGLSYPLYLNHWLGLAIIHGLARHMGLSELEALPFIAYLASILMSIPLYMFIDRYVSENRNNWFNPKLGLTLGLISYSLVIVGIIGGVLMYQYGPHGTIPHADSF